MKITEAMKLGNGKARLTDYTEDMYAYLDDNGTLYCTGNSTHKLIPFNDIIREDWKPFYDGKIVVPETGGEVWKHDSGKTLFILEGKGQQESFMAGEAIDLQGRCRCLSSINTYDEDVRIRYGGILLVHGYDGWARVYPKIDDE